jgi:hypothetical protein
MLDVALGGQDDVEPAADAADADVQAEVEQTEVVEAAADDEAEQPQG